MLHTIILLPALLPLAFYLLLSFKAYKLKTIPESLSQMNQVNGDEEVTVVISARNESQYIRESLASILSQQHVRQIILIDDHSTDNTLSIAQKESLRDKRLVVLSAPDLPDGWIGKSHALNCGARDISTEYMLFTDADVILSPGTISAAASLMSHRHLDHLSGNFYIHCDSVGEHLCAPVLAASSALALFHSAPNHGSATGAFNMIRSDFYHKIGGHQPIRNHLVDDVALARLVKSNGGQTDFIFFADRARVRLFQGVRGYFNCIARSSQSYLGNSLLLPLFGGLTITCLSFSALLTLALPSLPEPYWIATTMSVISYLLGLFCFLCFRPYHNGNICFTFLYPIAVCLLGLATTYSSLVKIFGLKITWRDRKYLTA